MMHDFPHPWGEHLWHNPDQGHVTDPQLHQGAPEGQGLR